MAIAEALREPHLDSSQPRDAIGDSPAGAAATTTALGDSSSSEAAAAGPADVPFADQKDPGPGPDAEDELAERQEGEEPNEPGDFEEGVHEDDEEFEDDGREGEPEEGWREEDEEDEEEEWHEGEDQCPDDDEKTEPGVCGCGVREDVEDADEDGVVNCLDACPLNPHRQDGDCPCKFSKPDRGICGCSLWDDDEDEDGVPDCKDACPSDPAKSAPGACGCGHADVDTDMDGTPDCVDLCPRDPTKTTPGSCGCGVSDVDTDLDGSPNCHDSCPLDPQKTVPGLCGCGVPEDSCSGLASVVSLDDASGSVVAAVVVISVLIVFFACRRLLRRNYRRYQPLSPRSVNKRMEGDVATPNDQPSPSGSSSPGAFAGSRPLPELRTEGPPPSWNQRFTPTPALHASSTPSPDGNFKFRRTASNFSDGEPLSAGGRQSAGLSTPPLSPSSPGGMTSVVGKRAGTGEPSSLLRRFSSMTRDELDNSV